MMKCLYQIIPQQPAIELSYKIHFDPDLSFAFIVVNIEKRRWEKNTWTKEKSHKTMRNRTEDF